MPKMSYTPSYPHYPQEISGNKSGCFLCQMEHLFCEVVIKGEEKGKSAN